MDLSSQYEFTELRETRGKSDKGKRYSDFSYFLCSFAIHLQYQLCALLIW